MKLIAFEFLNVLIIGVGLTLLLIVVGAFMGNVTRIVDKLTGRNKHKDE